MLSTFVTVLAVSAFIGAHIAIGVPFVRAGNRVFDGEATFRQIAPTLAGCAAALVVVWTLGIYVASTADNDSEHCGPGTRYVSHQVGKHVEWQCIARED